MDDDSIENWNGGFIHPEATRKRVVVGCICESTKQFMRVIEENALDGAKSAEYEVGTKTLIQYIPVRYKVPADLKTFNIQKIAIVKDWTANAKVSYELIDAAAKHLGLTYKQVYNTAISLHDTATSEQRAEELALEEKLMIFDELGKEEYVEPKTHGEIEDV